MKAWVCQSGHGRWVARLQPRVASDRGCIPRGTLTHRHWFCLVIWRRVIGRVRNGGDEVGRRKFLAKLRSIRLKAQESWLDHWEHGKEVNRALWERALDTTAIAGIQGPAKEATFHWKMQDGGDGAVEGDLYSDASGLDGHGGVGRLGWAFAVVKPGSAEVVAAAYGIPPRWVDSVPKAEAWGLLMAVRNSMFVGTTATLDCMSVVQVLRGGEEEGYAPREGGRKTVEHGIPVFR